MKINHSGPGSGTMSGSESQRLVVLLFMCSKRRISSFLSRRNLAFGGEYRRSRTRTGTASGLSFIIIIARLKLGSAPIFLHKMSFNS